MILLKNFINGNSEVNIYDDGTRVINYEDDLKLDYPLNIDIRVSSKCAFGYNPVTNTAFCGFCHESARTDGTETDYIVLKKMLGVIPPGIELAIGANNLTPELYSFLEWCSGYGFIVNLTINQGHLNRDLKMIESCIENNLIKGLGISYRSTLKWTVPQSILDYPNTVFHVIIGIDNIIDVIGLSMKGVRKVLCLGEKDFGFNKGNVDLTTKNHKEWFWWIMKLHDIFGVVSFDNLALQQLNMRRYFSQENWDVFNQNENSFYIDSVNGILSPSSRSDDKTDWMEMSLVEYFQKNN